VPADLFRATFTAPDGTAVAAYTPEVGSAPANVVGSWGVTAGRLTCLTKTNDTFNYCTAGAVGQRQYVCGTFQTPASGGYLFGLQLNFVDDNNTWWVYNDATSLRILETTAGVETSRANVVISLTADTVYNYRCGADGDEIYIQVLVSGVWKTASYTVAGRANKTATALRFFFDGTAAYGIPSWDDIRITSYNPFLNVHLDTSLGADVWEGNYSRGSMSALAFTSGDGSAWDGPAFATPQQAGLYAMSGGTVWCRGGQTSLGAGTTFPGYLQPYGTGHVTLDGAGQYSAGNAGPVLTFVGTDGGMLGTYDQRFRVRGTHSDGDTTDPNADTDVSIKCYLTGVATFLNVECYESGHAGLKFYAASAAGSKVETCVFRDGGFTARDHGVYDPYGGPGSGSKYLGDVFHDITGYGLHGYNASEANGPLQPVKAAACAAYRCGQVAGAGGMLIHGGAGPSLLHCTVTDCDGIGGVTVWGDATGATLKDNFIQCPLCDNDVHVNAVETASLFVAYNRKTSVGGNGSAAYASATDVTTADLFDSTPAVPTDLRRTGGLRDGADLGYDSRYRLDPTSVWPRLVYDGATPSVGAYALAGAGGTGVPMSRVFGGF
jgi:hypothetical protein